MSKKCCIFNCRGQKDDPGCLNLSFFQAPSNEERLKEWCNSIQSFFNKKVKFKKYSYVCALHFEPECFNYGGLCNIVRLKKGSCPTIFENYPPRKHQMQYVQDQIETSSDIINNEAPNGSKKDISLCTSKDHLPITCNTLTSIEEDLQENNFNARQLEDELQGNQLDVNDDSANTEQLSELNDMNKSSADLKEIKLQEVQKNFSNKSLVNINLDSIDYRNKNLIRKLLENAQTEVKTLRRYKQNQYMRLYRVRKKVKNATSLFSHVKQRSYISKQVSDILKVS